MLFLLQKSCRRSIVQTPSDYLYKLMTFWWQNALNNIQSSITVWRPILLSIVLSFLFITPFFWVYWNPILVCVPMNVSVENHNTSCTKIDLSFLPSTINGIQPLNWYLYNVIESWVNVAIGKHGSIFCLRKIKILSSLITVFFLYHKRTAQPSFRCQGIPTRILGHWLLLPQGWILYLKITSTWLMLTSKQTQWLNQGWLLVFLHFVKWSRRHLLCYLKNCNCQGRVLTMFAMSQSSLKRKLREREKRGKIFITHPQDKTSKYILSSTSLVSLSVPQKNFYTQDWPEKNLNILKNFYRWKNEFAM